LGLEGDVGLAMLLEGMMRIGMAVFCGRLFGTGVSTLAEE
jgi:hypothetical protein